MMSELGNDAKVSRVVETVSSVGNLPEGREGADDDKAGRDLRELRESRWYGRPFQWQRARRGGLGRLGRCGRRSKRVNVFQLRDDGTLGKRLYKEKQGQGKRRRQRQAILRTKRENDGRRGKERFRQMWRIQGGTFRRTARSRIPRTVLDVRLGRTQVISMSMGNRPRR